MIGDFLVHVRQRWYLYVPLTVIWALACLRMFVDPVPQLPLLFNVTPSLPYTVAIVQRRGERIERGDYVIYAFRGAATAHFPASPGNPFLSRLAVLPAMRCGWTGAESW
ncbi:hypothetical protein ACHMW6_25805 [Pseudoduganella sp. UC29_106]|uniref:hypothetical protein n=1 Tax=Pseudoduganella sp. UC29_106 TaxID=3374553 RepID=UPI003757F189